MIKQNLMDSSRLNIVQPRMRRRLPLRMRIGSLGVRRLLLQLPIFQLGRNTSMRRPQRM
jgi:hypothetical protein